MVRMASHRESFAWCGLFARPTPSPPPPGPWLPPQEPLQTLQLLLLHSSSASSSSLLDPRLLRLSASSTSLILEQAPTLPAVVALTLAVTKLKQSSLASEERGGASKNPVARALWQQPPAEEGDAGAGSRTTKSISGEESWIKKEGREAAARRLAAAGGGGRRWALLRSGWKGAEEGRRDGGLERAVEAAISSHQIRRRGGKIEGFFSNSFSF